MEPMINLSLADSVVLVVLTAFFLRSFFQGALKEVVSLSSILAGYVASFNSAPPWGSPCDLGWVALQLPEARLSREFS